MPQLTETDLREALKRGRPLGPRRATSPPTEVDAEVIREVILDCSSAVDRLTLRSTVIKASLDLSFHRVSGRLSFENCRFHERIDLTETSATGLDFSDCH